ncbi:hypothetical protein O3Q52_04020 [Streptomyces sp. ActVer]|uniref:hypothetical protein n=1 Tax=Streptomyces sp. ActVer TaxID=3014558 RepID=UPI0022B3A386|nr:hypothetical protein [Streptomyces sp. ActVer]MCZ4507386.1 hypothetical protein [Streptomyces sp. ActVer]
MYERRSTDPTPAPSPPPLGTIAGQRQPSNVRIGDFVCLDGLYLRVRDMRSAGTAGHRVLVFDGHSPWVMREPTTTYRPIELL